MRVGFIGLDNMGRPMALNVLRAGHTLVVLDLYLEAAGSAHDGNGWLIGGEHALLMGFTDAAATIFQIGRLGACWAAMRKSEK